MTPTARARGAAGPEVPGLAELPRAFTTRRVPDAALVGLDASPDAPPRSGDLVLCRIDGVRAGAWLQCQGARRKILFPGDLVIAVFGDRCTPRQLEAVLPRELGAGHLVAAGGVVARACHGHERSVEGPTEVTTLALVLGAAGGRINLSDFALAPLVGEPPKRPTVIACLGTSKTAGEGAAAAFLARGLGRAGLRTGFAQATGTGAGDDLWRVGGAGADPVLDFSDCGYASTHRLSPDRVEGVVELLLDHLAAFGVDVAVLGIADGLLQPETAALIRSPRFHARVDAALLAAPDALAAVAGVELCRAQGLRLLGITGSLTAGPPQRREAGAVTGLPVLGRAELACAVTAGKLAGQARA